MNETTRILNAIADGDRQAAGHLLPLVYEELRQLAARRLASEKPGQTLQPTALVHEAYLRLVGVGDQAKWENRAHFFAAAAEAMRGILVDNARRKHRLKHGGDRQRVELDQVEGLEEPPPDELLALNDALEELAALDSQKAELVKLRYFGGLTVEEAGRCLGVSRATADRYWSFARAWLFDRLQSD
jgi:RNA polymerase sigma factor (TIGR02999 family)